MKTRLMFSLLCLYLVSCGPSTKIVTAWRDPGTVIETSADKKVLVMALVKDEGSRRVVEDQLAKRMKGKGIASYTFVNETLLKQSETAFEDRLKSDKYNYVLIMRLAEIEKEINYVPGSTSGYYGGYGMYYRYAAPMYYDPGYYKTDKNYMIETTVYDVPANKLIWSSTTKTVNPNNMEKTINEIADVVTERMKQEGFLK